MRNLRLLLATTSLLGLVACSDLPTAGPSGNEVVDRFNAETKPKDNPLGIRLVELTPQIAQTLEQAPSASLRTLDTVHGSHPVDRIGPGDTLAISIYEAGPGLFAQSHQSDVSGPGGGGSGGSGTGVGAAGASASTAETLPRMPVDRSGRVTIPYVGAITVAGHTPAEVQQIIQNRLAGKAAEPQVLVNVISNETNTALLSGDIKGAGRVPLTVNGESLTDIVTLAGGPIHPPQDTLVRLTRHNQRVEEMLGDIQDSPDDNIAVEPQDRIQLEYRPRTFLAFGATGRVSQTPFDTRHLSLAEAVARSGGLDDQRANPEMLFLFRFENPAVVQSIGQSVATKGPVPIIYHVNMRDPQNLFLVQRVAMRDKDVLYVPNAHSVQIFKFLQMVSAAFTPVATVATPVVYAR